MSAGAVAENLVSQLRVEGWWCRRLGPDVVDKDGGVRQALIILPAIVDVVVCGVVPKTQCLEQELDPRGNQLSE
jgi:hypothetical protein